MTDDAQRWKSKYLESLEQQKKLERSWDARLDLLRRGLVRSSLAAEGSDKSVDQCMHELRDILRRNDIDAGLSALIPRLEKAVLDSEKQRQDRVEQNISGVTSLTDQLLALEPPREVRKALKQFAKRIEERASQPRELPALLSELSRLQQQALAVFDGEASQARPGFLQRLFGGKEVMPAGPVDNPPAPVEMTQSAASAPTVVAPPETPLQASDAPQRTSNEALVAVAVATTGSVAEPQYAPAVMPRPAPTAETPALVQGFGDPAYALPEIPEPGYSAVAPHIGDSLMGLLDELELPERHQPQGDALRQRVQGGLNWYELVSVLDAHACTHTAVWVVYPRHRHLSPKVRQFVDFLVAGMDGRA